MMITPEAARDIDTLMKQLAEILQMEAPIHYKVEQVQTPPPTPEEEKGMQNEF